MSFQSYQNADYGEDGLPEDNVAINTDSSNSNGRKLNAVLVVGLGMTSLLALSASGVMVTGPVVKSSALSASSTSSSSEYSPKYEVLDDDDKAELFTLFKAKYSKEYTSDTEETKRYDNFKTFLSLIDYRNSAEGQELHGITKFADMTPDEFKESFLGFQLTAARKAAIKSQASSSSTTTARASSNLNAATEGGVVNWYKVTTTEVKNQGYCGSCWAFSATAQVESDSILAGILTTSDDLAVQQVVSCASTSDGCYGCGGGDPTGAYDYITSVGGLESDDEYPYESYYGDTETCDADSSDAKVTVTGYTLVDSENEMIDYVTTTGPLSACVDASDWASYHKGVVSVCGVDIDHCIQITGINTDGGYWIVRNSWGTDWGDNGFIYLKSGSDTCGISYIPTYTTVKAV
jgi:cysteine peptidase B